MAKEDKEQPQSDEFDALKIADAEESATEVSKCPSCGANLTYSPAEKCLKCDYCGYKSKVDLTQYAEEIDFAQLLRADNTWGDETRVFVCNNCGAKQILSKRDLAPKCAFCGTSNIVESEDICGVKPNAVIPFAFGKEQACGLIAKWAKKKIFSPRKFKQSVYPEEIAGNYFPAFTFDSKTTTGYSGVLGKYYYTTHRDSKGRTYTTRHTRWFRIGGTYDRFFDDVFVKATGENESKMLKKIEPFNTSAPQNYRTDFLHGFSASQYERDGQECWKEARRRMENQIHNEILSKYHYDVVQSLNTRTRCFDMTYKYMLLPVYVGHYGYNKKMYNFFVNGQNGKIKGKTPKSPLRIGIAVLIGLAIAAGIAVLAVFALT